jgi:multiple sugar transport system ATP-binding protein
MRTEIAKLHNRIGVTTIYVTHDQTEAMTMADRIVVLKDGVVQQVDTPQVMYDHPKNIFVAGFIGSPAMNFIKGRLERNNGGYSVKFAGTNVPVSQEAIGQAKERGSDLESFAGKDVVLGVRPEHMEDAETEEAQAMASESSTSDILVDAQVIESMGSEKYVYFNIPRENIANLQGVAATTGEDGENGADGGGSAEDMSGEMMVARVSAASTARIGQQMKLVVDATKIRLFDAETEQAIL